MPSTWTRTVIAAASAMLLSTAAFAVAATGNPEQPPAETGGQSRPVETQGKSRAYELRQQGTAPKKCRSGADNEAEAVKDCTASLNCPAGTTVKCSYRSNNQDWICSCK